MGDVMKIPKLSDNVKEFFQYVLSRSKKTCDGLMYIGDYKGGYIFVSKLPKSLRGLCVGLPIFYYVKDYVVSVIDEDENEELYDAAWGMLDPDNEDKFYTITLDDENK